MAESLEKLVGIVLSRKENKVYCTSMSCEYWEFDSTGKKKVKPKDKYLQGDIEVVNIPHNYFIKIENFLNPYYNSSREP